MSTPINPVTGKKLHPKTKFTPEEDALLKQLVDAFGDSDWARISRCIPNRNVRQCRERWKIYLSPDVNKGPWSEEDDLKLAEYYNKIGPKWTEIAKKFSGRTDVNVKSHWQVVQRRLSRGITDLNKAKEVPMKESVAPLIEIPKADGDVPSYFFDDQFPLPFDEFSQPLFW